MIAKVKTTNNPVALIDYIFNDKNESMANRAELISSNFCGTNTLEIKRDWNHYLYNTNKVLTKTAMHLIFSLAEGEKLTNEQWKDFLDTIVTEKLGLSDYAWTAVKHLDTESKHSHIHLAVCRVSPITGEVLSDSQSYYKAMEMCRAAEKKYDLQKVNNPWEKQYMQYDSRKAILKFKIEMALKVSTNMHQFQLELEKENIKVIRSRGIGFVDEQGMYVKGSDKQIGYSYQKINELLQHNRTLPNAPHLSYTTARTNIAPTLDTLPSKSTDTHQQAFDHLLDMIGMNEKHNMEESGGKQLKSPTINFNKKKKKKGIKY